MVFPAAKKGDRIVSTDFNVIMIQSAEAQVTAPISHLFTGIIDGNLSQNVRIMGLPAATADSEASSQLSHIPAGMFQNCPPNKARIKLGSSTVKINGKMAARNGDKAIICNDSSGMQTGTVIATGTVFIG